MNRVRALGLALVLLLIPSADPAHALYWEQSGCRPDVWYAYNAGGWEYWHAHHGQHYVYGMAMRRYGWEGWECGYLGTVTGPQMWTFWCDCDTQTFEHGYLIYVGWYQGRDQGWNVCYYGDYCYD